MRYIAGMEQTQSFCVYVMSSSMGVMTSPYMDSVLEWAAGLGSLNESKHYSELCFVWCLFIATDI